MNIDFNVCFEKERRLRVLRLTQSLQHVLGLAGTMRCKGLFRGTARFALALLRANSRCLRTLFAAFIFDPISEWLSKQSADYLQRQIMNLDHCRQVRLVARRARQAADRVAAGEVAQGARATVRRAATRTSLLQSLVNGHAALIKEVWRRDCFVDKFAAAQPTA